MENSHQQKVKLFFDKTDNYLSKSFGVRLRKEIVREQLGDLYGVNILDIGCGDGTISLQYANNENSLTLIDISEKMLDLAREKVLHHHLDKVALLNMDVCEHQPEELYDVVICMGLLAHVASVEKTVEKISNLLRVGGYCILQYTDQEQFASKINWWIANKLARIKKNYEYKINLLFHQRLMALLDGHDFIIIRAIRFSLLFPGMGNLPDSFLYKYQLMSLKFRWLGRMGTDVILLLQKGIHVEDL